MKRANSYRRIAAAREQQATKLRTFAQALVVGGADPLHDLELVRSAEIEVEPTRRAIIREARADGFDWQQIGDILHVTAEVAELRYGSTET